MVLAGLASLAVLTGCARDRTRLAEPRLARLAPSAELAPCLDAGLARLSGPDPGDPAGIRDLQTYYDLQQGIYDPRRRAAAVDSLLALWERQPDHVLWPELAVRERRLFDDPGRIEPFFASPACADTATAIGAYLAGWKVHTVAALTTFFPAAYARSAGLAPFPAAWIELRAAYAMRLGGDGDGAFRVARGGLARAAAAGGRPLEARFWLEIGRIRLAQGELDDALFAAVMADTLTAASIPGGGALVPRLITREFKADVLAMRQEVDAALGLFGANADTAARLHLPPFVSRSLNRAGVLAGSIGDRRSSVAYGRRALAFALADLDSLNIPRHMMNIARSYRILGRLDSCLVYQQRAERWVAAYPHPANRARMPLMQAEYQAQVGRYDLVDSLLGAAVALTPEKDTVEVRSELHLELIRGWMEAGRPDLVYRSLAAIEDLRLPAGDTHADRHVAADINLLAGDFLTRRGEYARAAEALDLAADALERRGDPQRAWTLARNRGILARERGSLAAAAEEFRRCVALGTELGVPEQESTGRFLLSSVLLAQGRGGEARAALPATDPARFVGRFTTRISALLLVGVSHRLEGRPDLALAAIGEARAACRSWSPADLLARIDLEEGLALAAAGRPDAAARRYEDVAARLEQPGWDLTTPELEYFNGDLRRDLVEAAIALPNLRPAETLHLARRVLPQWRETAAAPGRGLASPQIIFFVGRETSGRWFVTGRAIRWSALPGESALRDLLAPALADLATPARAVPTGSAAGLARVLLPDVAAAWLPEADLTIVPDLALAGVPWAALPLPGVDAAVIDHGPLAVCDRPRTRVAETRPGRTGRRMLVVGADGNAGVDAAGLPALRHAEAEARDVAAVWPAGAVTLRLGPAAAHALAPDGGLASYDVVHVASHALVYRGRPDRTMLLLAGRNDEPWTADAIAELELGAELVFLSCCEAGDGRDTRSGDAGLAAAFHAAGARNVVAPLIAIDDAAARALAVRFYTHWLDGRSVPQALRAAQRDLRDGDGRWTHPYYWAFYQPTTAP